MFYQQFCFFSPIDCLIEQGKIMLNKVLISFILLTFIFSTCKSETETKTEKGLQIESNAKGKSQRDGKGDYQ